MNHQQIRPSQLITTYGPGSLIETPSGPVAICSLDRIFQDNRLSLTDFEIVDARLAQSPSLNGAGIVRIPVNAEVRAQESQWLYRSEALPFWSLCVEHRILYASSARCPNCALSTVARNRTKAGREAIRFVRACTNGHLDDVDWHYVVHGGPKCTNQSGHYLWQGGGSSLRNVTISCPDCQLQINFGTAYSRTWPCSERLPENGPRPPQANCSAPARIVQRGAANLRVPDFASALTIPPLATRLTSILQDSRIMTLCNMLNAQGQISEIAFRNALGFVQPPLGQSVMQFLQQCSWPEIQQAIGHVLAVVAGLARPLKEEEFDSLQHAATFGAPPVSSSQIGAPPLFEVRLTEVRNFSGPSGRHVFRVVPVSRLRMVMVQLGYRRLDPPNAQLVTSGFSSNGRTWYPGVELFGEGIYLDFGSEELPLTGSRYGSWMQSYMASAADETLHPVHVWWHTLAHRLMRAFAIDSGYSSASIRERVFFRQRAGESARGGVLLYTVQPGGDGTLGGLLALVPRFDRVLASALRDLNNCSNDPLCAEAVPNGINGAACYSCLLASETSCEYRNIHLDRTLLLENLP